jgi:3-hydroxyacyl-[acyl-carrier-protein] dehydratase
MITQEEIKKVIPHRGGMLLVDEIREYGAESGVGVHHVRADEFWCAGHFPGRPIMPGVLQVEALAQVACFVVMVDIPASEGRKLGYFTTMDKIRFFHMVKPGDTLELNVELLGGKMNFHRFHGIGMVAGVKVCEADFTAFMDNYKNE